jgi:TatD DNase family protein
MERALKAGVWMINIGTTQEYSKKAVDMTREYTTGVFAVVGMHPTEASKCEFDKEFFKKLIVDGGKKVVGIGECGLDYFRSTAEEEHKKQREVFIFQIELALEFDLPLILHVRNAYTDVLVILKAYKERYGDKLRGDVHFFAGTVEEAKEFLDLGFYLSYTGVVTFAKQYVELVKATPLDRIMSETDCPYVAPAPMRGKRNEPLFVTYIADKIAEIKGLDPIECRKQLVENAFRLFKLTA